MRLRATAAVAVAGALVAPAAAHAHAFATGRDAYGNFLDGAGVALASPGLVLPVLALAIMLGLWRREGLLDAWPMAALGSVLGLAVAPLAGPWAGLAAMGIGLVTALLAALVPLARVAASLPLLAALLAAAVMAAALEGHRFAEVPHATRVGLLFGMHFSLAAGAGLVRLTHERIRHPATTIAWRVVASWLAAILVLYLAFSLVG